MEEKKSLEIEKTDEKKTHIPKNKFNKKLILFIGGIVVFLMLGIMGGVLFFKGNNIAQVSKKDQKVKFVGDALRARSTIIKPNSAATVQVFADDKTIVTLEIPKGSVIKQEKITITPYKDASKNLQIKISPTELVFKSPVSLIYDFSRTEKVTDAPNALGSIRNTGKTQILKIDGDKKYPMLIARGIETNKSLTARILGGGVYQFANDDSQIANAKDALSRKGLSTLTIIESGNVLFFNNQKITTVEKERIKKAADKIIGIKDVSFIELFPAIQLQKKLTASKLLPQVFAADITAQYLEIRCKDRTLSIEEYVIVAQTAQLTGHDDIGKKCMDAAKAKVADQARDVLGNSSATVSQIIRMMGKTQAFGLDELSSALEQKLQKTVKDKIQETLDDPNSTLEDLVKALQDAQVTGQDSDFGDQLDKRIGEAAKAEIDRVLNDPNSNMLDVAKATQKAQAFGLEDSSKQGLDRLSQMSKRSSEEILNSANPTAKELEFALGAANLEGKDMAYRNKIRERIKEAQKKEEQPTPTPTPTQSSPEDLVEGIDWGILAEPLLQLVGINSLDEQTLKNWAKEKSDQAHELLEMGPEVCDMVRREAPEMYTGEIVEKCNYLENGEAEREIEKAIEDVNKVAEEIGELQSSDYEEPDESPHMEIEFTPTPEPEENIEVGVEDQDPEIRDSNLEMESNSDDSMEDNSQEGVDSFEVQGVNTQTPLTITDRIKIMISKLLGK